jgi:hypothetical protein
MTRRETVRLLGGAAGAAFAVHAKPTVYSLRKAQGKVLVLAGNRPFTALHHSGEWDRPFLHPLVTPSGVEMSRGLPPGSGEDQDHAWHRGLWYGHGNLSGSDFWREKVDAATGRKLTGRIVVSKPPELDMATDTVSIRGDLTTAEGIVLGGVMERFRFSGTEHSHIIDISIAIVADGKQDLVMGDTDDGGLAVRLTTEFTEKSGAILLNSEGRQGADALWGNPARWVDYTATRNGKPCGVSILDHPHNFRYPTRWHARGYGLNSANPFAVGSFKRAASKEKSYRKDGEWTIRQGTQLAFRYRVVLHDGDAAQAGIESMHNAFTRLEARLR